MRTSIARALAVAARVVVVCTSSVVAVAPAHALAFEDVPRSDGSTVLLAFDCRDSETRQCKPNEKGFSKGDGQRIDALLRAKPYAEVLLHSGGGNLAEGVAVGEALRRHGMAVRVAPKSHCVSACTVAFLGGVIRTVDEGATYEVHAYSGWSEGLADELKAEVLTYPERTLRDLARKERLVARDWTFRLLHYMQRMIGGRPDEAALRSALASDATGLPRYVSSGQLAADVVRISAEGPAAAQTALMNLERDAVEENIEKLRPQASQLGPRASSALAMLDAMFSSAIIRTAPLPPEVLKRMGYVTPVIGGGR